MPAIRIVLLVLVGGGLALFAVSNLSPVLPLVFLGMQTPALPVSVWIGIAIAAGAFSSFFIQFLNYLQQGSSRRSLEEPGAVPPRSRAFRRETAEAPEPERPFQYTPPPPPPPPPETPTKSVASDWEQSSGEDWDFEEERAAPTSKEQGSDTDSSKSTPQTDRTSYEVPQEPKAHSQTGSVYSYSYREPKESGVGKSEAVYDANYRVITPPFQKPPEPEEDEEDWGFEDDEDFEFDDKAEGDRGRR